MIYHCAAPAETSRGSFLNISAQTSLTTSVQGVVIDHKCSTITGIFSGLGMPQMFQHIHDVDLLTSTMGGEFCLR
jgi:hypothetical protein